MAIELTREQRTAAANRGGDLLVAAAAGSGKTRVLVERLMGYVEQGEDIDRFLVITFTNAAAAELRDRMIPFASGDLLRLPTEKEIFGCNEYGKAEPESVQQFEPMKSRRNRIAFRGEDESLEWYWLENEVEGYAAGFALVNADGAASYYFASAALGVRPAFKIRYQ